VIFLGILSSCAFAQGFTQVDDGMVSVGRSSVAWGDYDGDADLDVLVTGDHGTGPYIASVYRNDAGEFTNINAGLTGIYNSAVTWGDYDNDGDLDILACGRNINNSKTYIYQNTNGAFIQIEAGLPNIGSDGAVVCGDYDGDGDLDILMGGAYSCRIFNNQSGLFTDINAGLPAVSNCWVDWGDFDNDGDLDVFVMGDLGGILISAIYRNDQTVFTEMPQAALTPLAGGSASWCDFDHDSDLDLLITGFNEFLEPYTTLFSNLGNMEFLDLDPGMRGASLGTAAWADFDNDGETDMLLTGQSSGCGVINSLIYRNEGNSSFTDIDAPLEGAERGSAACGDYDNDSDLDILISGITVTGTPETNLYSNTAGTNVYSVNQKPSVPGGLSAYVDGHYVVLGWGNSSDDHTPANSLTYNLRIVNSQGTEVVPSMAHAASGKRLLPVPGNSGNATDWVFNLPDDTYTWSVQAIDNAFAASAFSEVYTFSILNVGMNDKANAGVKIFPNPVTDRLDIQADEMFGYEISSSTGNKQLAYTTASKTASINTSDWTSGIYILKVVRSEKVSFHKIIKK
jgi:hypothetical protein